MSIPSGALNLADQLPDRHIMQADTVADQIVARYLEAIGGADAVRAVVSRRITYWVHMFGSDAYLMERSWTRPDTMRTGRPGATTYTVTEGERSWRNSPDGERELPAAVARSMRKLADIDSPLVDPVGKGVTFAYVGVVRYDMTDLQRVTVTFADGVQWEYFFDSSTGLLRRRTQPSFVMLNGRVSRGPDAHYFYYDHRPVEGVLYPHLWIQSTDDHTHLFVVEEIAVQRH
jgi:hypothetical protein